MTFVISLSDIEPHKKIIDDILKRGIRIGKIQISAAIKCMMDVTDRKAIRENFESFNEPTYLHQVVAKMLDGSLTRYPDLPQALAQINDPDFKEWRAHFHVPLFTETFGVLSSTQDEIKEVLSIQKKDPFTNHLEVETYTWDVLPAELKLPLADSIVRELQWVKEFLND